MFAVRNTLAPLCALLFLVGCGARDLSSLPTPSASKVEFTNDYPSVVKVISPGGSGLCTGTFVSARAVLTASHCTQSSGTYTVITSFGTFYTSNRRNYGPGVVNDPRDISVLWFNSDVADENLGQVSKIGYGVREDDIVRLVGFGCGDIETRLGAGFKRTGTNAVYQISDYIELITPLNTGGGQAIIGPVNRAGSCFGDSGGPMFLDFGGELRVVGVTHAGGYDSQYAYSDYVSLDRGDNRGFISGVNDDYNLGIEL
ncbi:MAG: trypsin-like serine protease [Bdellovibrionaceae bacterium]|nr:trypsin-like serine protease [Bdellovibrionales bacterium]MCB9255262.1 trypsin-like serine protease [Pseudobdellovibrionaceae bacterium]